MAFYGNFEGTLKSTILIGKGGIKLDSTSQKLNVYDSSGILTNIRIADAVGLTDAVTYNQFQGLVHSLGSASTKNESYFATSAQGLKADSAVQPLNNISILTNDAGYLVKSVADTYYATVLQGTKADTAVQPNNHVSVLINDAGYLIKSVADTYYATVQQGTKADSALQSGNNVSLLINDAGYLVKTVADTYYSLITHSHSLLDTSTSANTPSTLVLRDGSGNSHLNVLGNASTASKLETSRNITIQGDINAVIPFDGSMDLNITGTFSNTGVVAGTYNSSSGYYPFTVDSKGRITSVGSLIPISSAWSSITATPTTISGYGISDAVNLSQLGVANGIATLDASAKIPASQLPSYVDDVLEFTNLASFPVTGETGKIYVDTTTNKVYRWSGSVYVIISASPGTTDAIVEGTTNLYFTTTRAQAAAPVQTVQGRTGAVVITASDLSLGNLDNVKQLPYAQSLITTGDVTSTSTLLNSGTIALTLADTGVSSGTYNNSSTAITPIVVDSKGRITSTGAAVTITPAWSSITATPSTLSGYGITDAQRLNANLTSVSSLSNIVTGLVKFTNGVASLDTSVYLTSNQNITVTGDATGSGTTSIALTLAASGVTSGTYNNSSTAITPIVVDSKGRITATGTKVTITPAFSSITSKPTTISGYGITDAQRLNANLTSISGLSTSSTGYIVMTNGVASLSASGGSSAITLDAFHNYKGTDSELAANQAGALNIAIGYQSLNANTIGSYNVSLGSGALNANTIGSYNVSLGSEALKTNVAGSGSVAVGFQSQFYANNSVIDWNNYNTSVGYQALYGSDIPENNIGNYNTAIGYQSLNLNSSGSDNTAIGFNTLFSNTSGSNNTVLGFQGFNTVTTGSNNTGIGYGVTAFAAASYSTAIGAAASVTTSNTVVLGRITDVTVIGATGNNGSGNKLQVSGTIGCTTPTVGDNSTKVATTAFVTTALGAYVAPNKMSLNTQTGTAYTLVLADYTSALMVEMNNAAANTVTIPPNSSVAFPVGATIPIRQYGAGQTTIVAGSGVTIRNAYATLKIAAQYGLVRVHQRATNEWVIEGYLAAS